uniref:Uncharacterized protein TCIL3000_10_3300 n=1 Tax=Trypanosoma congolense (strain IL3000) TaxID=1068625 RepID=G0UW03_TRYCI|nr:unnamed protein product [Trypanosoma congolense IL3000]
MCVTPDASIQYIASPATHQVRSVIAHFSLRRVNTCLYVKVVLSAIKKAKERKHNYSRGPQSNCSKGKRKVKGNGLLVVRSLLRSSHPQLTPLECDCLFHLFFFLRGTAPRRCPIFLRSFLPVTALNTSSTVIIKIKIRSPTMCREFPLHEQIQSLPSHLPAFLH